MAWMITRDLLNEQGISDDSAVGTAGPAGITDLAVMKMERGEGHMFLMFDDDDELYYEGLLLGDKDSEQGFAPLDDFGMPDSGCTYIKYYNETTKEWEVL